MKIVLLHGLGQTARDWRAVAERLSPADIDAPELFSLAAGEPTYPELLAGLERRCENAAEPLCLCGLSLGAVLALDFALRHGDRVAALVLCAVQYKVPGPLIDLQNILFRCMPGRAFGGMGLSKGGVIRLARSMRALDFSGRLGELACPVTIVCGEKDRANRRAALRLRGLLPQSRLRLLPGAGHEVNKSAPGAVAEILGQLAK